MRSTPPITSHPKQKALQIQIDREICIGASACVAAAGYTFALDKEGKSRVIDPKGDTAEAIQKAVIACPTGAIKLEKAPD